MVIVGLYMCTLVSGGGRKMIDSVAGSLLVNFHSSKTWFVFLNPLIPEAHYLVSVKIGNLFLYELNS